MTGMNRSAIALMTLLALGACGVDGEPLRPAANAGITIGPGGVRTTASVGVDAGNASVRVGL